MILYYAYPLILIGYEDTEITRDDYTISDSIRYKVSNNNVAQSMTYPYKWIYTFSIDNTSGTSDLVYNRIGLAPSMSTVSGYYYFLTVKDECNITVPAGEIRSISYTMDITDLGK